MSRIGETVKVIALIVYLFLVSAVIGGFGLFYFCTGWARQGGHSLLLGLSAVGLCIATVLLIGWYANRHTKIGDWCIGLLIGGMLGVPLCVAYALSGLHLTRF